MWSVLHHMKETVYNWLFVLVIHGKGALKLASMYAFITCRTGEKYKSWEGTRTKAWITNGVTCRWFQPMLPYWDACTHNFPDLTCRPNRQARIRTFINKYGNQAVEVQCKYCGGFLGHGRTPHSKYVFSYRTQPLTEMTTIGVKSDRRIRLTTSQPSLSR
jgi:hypothetical protein